MHSDDRRLREEDGRVVDVSRLSSSFRVHSFVAVVSFLFKILFSCVFSFLVVRMALLTSASSSGSLELVLRRGSTILINNIHVRVLVVPTRPSEFTCSGGSTVVLQITNAQDNDRSLDVFSRSSRREKNRKKRNDQPRSFRRNSFQRTGKKEERTGGVRRSRNATRVGRVALGSCSYMRAAKPAGAFFVQ